MPTASQHSSTCDHGSYLVPAFRGRSEPLVTARFLTGTRRDLSYEGTTR